MYASSGKSWSGRYSLCRFGRAAQIHTHWERLEGPACPWQEISDEFTTDCRGFKERHYVEFVAFMPHVQRFLYGEGATTAPGAAQRGYGVSPIRVFRRRDVTRVRVILRREEPTIEFHVTHIDRYFFYDIDVAILAVEIHREDLTLAQAQDMLCRFGRTYPTSWAALWCINGLPELPILRSVFQMIRTETGMPNLVIRLSTLHPIFASVR